jgi:dipeptidyl aminopeptidase/acylaminoacyl peptidase
MRDPVRHAWLALLTFMLSYSVEVRAAVPLEAFVAPPKISSPQISPDGRYLAFARRNDSGTTTLLVIDLNTPGSTPTGFNMPAGSQVAWVDWKDNKRAVASLILGRDIYLGDAGHVDLPSGPQIVSFDADGKNFKTLFDLTKFHGPRGYGLVHRLPQDPHHVLMGLVDKLGRFNLHRVNVYDGQHTEVETGNKYTTGWLADQQGNPRVRWERHFYQKEMWVRSTTTKDWEMVARYEDRGFPEKVIVGFADDPAIAIVADRKGGDRFALHEYNFATRTFGRSLIDHPSVDVGWPIGYPVYDGNTGALGGACFADDVWFCRYFDPLLTGVQQKLESTFSDAAIVRLLSWSNDRKRFVVLVSGPKNPGAYYLFDADNANVTAIGKHSPQLPENELGEQIIVKYPTRDGMKIPAYLTLPPGRPDKNLPLVVMPHGGPEHRDTVGYDPWVQMLATRGFAVLQPNFRGSGGYGKRFTEAGYRQWGRKMQDDVTDGVKALIKDGTVDANRVCIVGASYGGYSALAGGAFTPEMYKCVVAIAGVSDLVDVLKYEENTGNPDAFNYWKRWIGDPKVDMAEIKAASPINFASKFAAPVLLVHGKYDYTVRPGQSMLMSRALKEAGKPVELIIVEFEGHSFYLERSKLQLLKDLERFVTQHLGK